MERGKRMSMKNIVSFNTVDMLELQLVSTSKGNQRKWYLKEDDVYVKEQFFYQGRCWKDYLVEVIASTIGKQMSVKSAPVVQQNVCKIVDFGRISFGVYSSNFATNAKYISVKRVLDSNSLYFEEEATIAEKWELVLGAMKEFCKLDYTDFLVTMVLLDYLVGNEDRHINNFGVLALEDKFQLSPLFDFGLGLFEHDLKYDHVPFRQCLELMYSKPFDRDNQKVINFVSERYNLSDYLPKTLDLSGTEIPSAKAGSYLRNRCMKLGIELKGVI